MKSVGNDDNGDFLAILLLYVWITYLIMVSGLFLSHLLFFDVFNDVKHAITISTLLICPFLFISNLIMITDI